VNRIQKAELTPEEKRRRDDKLWKAVVLGLAAGFVLMSLVAGILVHITVRDLVVAGAGVGVNRFQPDAGAHPNSTGQATPIATVMPLVQPTAIPWEGNERVTILLMGLDYRDWIAGQGPPRTDSMILLTIDPMTRKMGMLSVPRDLWVEIPSFNHNRINTAYMFGEAYRLPGGGPGLAMQTVEGVIGVPIQFYAVIDFHTFERLIDEIGGIEVLVTERIKIAPIGRESKWLEAKAYHLDGADALAYARVRKYGGADFGRAKRQQQVAMAILDRVVGFDMVPLLLAKAPTLYQELTSGFRTNMTLDQMIALGWMAIKIPRDEVQMGVIEPPKMVGFYTRPDGASVLRAVTDAIRVLRDQIFTDTSGYAPLRAP